MSRTAMLGPILASSVVFCASCGESTDEGSLEPEAAPRSVWFKETAARAGVDFVHDSGHRNAFYTPEVVSGGVALLDADADGDLDLYLVQAGTIEGVASDRSPNRLYENRGDATFDDVTAASGAGDRGYGVGVATGDANDDGAIDLYVTNLGPNVLLFGAGDCTFSDVTFEAGVGDEGFGSSAAFLDHDRDGDLDLYVANYLVWTVETEQECSNGLGQRDYCAPSVYNAPAVDVLYRNEGDGTFTDVTEEVGLSAAFGTGLGVACGDFTGDGWVDLFIANDGRPDQLWVNLEGERFEDRALMLGCAMDNDGIAKAGMGVTAADIDDDGDLDVLVSNLRRESDSFFLNRGTYFHDATALSGLGLIGRGFTRFGTGWVDFDNDGRLDLYQANGRVVTDADDHGTEDGLAEPNLLYRGLGEGRFEEVALRGGTDPTLIHTSRGAAFGDLDGDGGVDVVVANRDAAPYVLRNVVSSRGNWISVRALDEHGRDAIGASVALELEGRMIRRDVRTAYSYCAASDVRVHFGLGSAAHVASLEVVWVDGACESFTIPAVNQVLELRKGSGQPVRSAPR